MKTILARMVIIGAIAATAVSVSGAYFSDTEQSLGNTLTAGRLDLLVNGVNNPTSVVNITDLKPGDNQIVDKHLFVDFNPAKIYLHLKDLVASQGAQTEPETVEENGTPKFDIQNFITYDLNIGGISPQTIIAASDNIPLPDAVSCWIPLGTIPGNTDVVMQQSFHFDPAVTNWAQGDMLSFTEEFLAMQINDPTVPVTGTGRVWDAQLKKCIDSISPTPTQSPTPSTTPTPTPATDPGERFVDAATAVLGTFGHCCDANNLSSDPSVAAAATTGAPDSPPGISFIQISDTGSVTFKFVNNKAVDGTGADIRVHIYDTLFPSSAMIEIGQGPDCATATYQSAGIFIDTTDADIDLGSLAIPPAQAQCVRITDQVADGDPFPTLGFDVDAIEALNSEVVL